MKNQVFWALLAVILTGCQTPSMTSLPGMPRELQPIEGKLTIGNLRIADAPMTRKNRVTVQNGGQSGRFFVVLDITMNAERQGPEVTLEEHFRDVRTDSYHLMFFSLYSKQMEAMRGLTNTFVVDMPSGRTKVTHRKGPLFASGTSRDDGQLAFDALLELVHLGGETVTQDGEVLRYRLGDLIPDIDPDAADRTYVLQAIGTATHDGRDVVVIKGEGSMMVDNMLLEADARYLVDLETGAALYSVTRLIGSVENGNEVTILVTQTLAVDQHSAPPMPGHGVTAFAL